MKYTVSLFLTRQQITDALTAAGFEIRENDRGVDGYWRLPLPEDEGCHCGVGELVDVANFTKPMTDDPIPQIGFVTVWRHTDGVTVEGAWETEHRDSRAAYLASQALNKLDTRTDADAH